MPGTAVFLTSTPDSVPNALLHNMKHNKVVHERLVLLTVTPEEIPRLEDRDRITVHALGHNAWRIVVRYGFTENPDLPHALALCEPHGLSFEMIDTTFFPGPGHADSYHSGRHGAVARKAVRQPVSQRYPPDGFLPHPVQPGGGTGYAGGAVSR